MDNKGNEVEMGDKTPRFITLIEPEKDRDSSSDLIAQREDGSTASSILMG